LPRGVEGTDRRARALARAVTEVFSHALVTGGAGFIGSHLTRRLLAAGHGVTVLDNLSVGRREAVPEGARFVHGDIRNDADLSNALHGVDCVFHLAAQVTIRGSFDRFYEDLDTNVMGTARLLRALDPARIKWFTLASSMAVYADAPTPAPINESHPTQPISPYGIGKLAAEGVSRQILESRGIPFTAVRYFNTFGPGQTYTPYVGVITIFVTRLLKGEPITIFGDGKQQRDLVHVEDIAAGTLATVGRTPGTYNLGTGTGTSLNELASLLIHRIAPGAAPRSAPLQAGELRFSIADIRAARQALGYTPTRSLASDIDNVIADVQVRLRSAAL
jgi:UDP-glucose 4-epimerase